MNRCPSDFPLQGSERPVRFDKTINPVPTSCRPFSPRHLDSRQEEKEWERHASAALTVSVERFSSQIRYAAATIS